MTAPGSAGAIHVVLPDTQIKPGVPTAHLGWIGQYIVDRYAGRENVKIIHLGDHWDMPSLSSYDKGRKSMEGRRVLADVAAGNDGFAVLNEPFESYNAKQRATKHATWNPEKHLLRGNHEHRIQRAIEDDAQMDGLLSYDMLLSPGWEVHDFLEVIDLDGVWYSHFFQAAGTGRPLGGTAMNRLVKLGNSFTQGHQQTYDPAVRFLRDGRQQRGLVVGACLTPDHKVLTADLRYVALADLKVGDKLVSFDENVEDSVGRARRYKTGTVNALKLDEDEVFAVTMSDGKTFKVTADHLWLVKTGSQYRWARTDTLRKGSRPVKSLDEWEADNTRAGGYLAGMYDGEGCYYTREAGPRTVGQLTLSQKPGAVMDATKAALREVLGIETTTNTNTRGVESVRIKGGLRQVARVLGTLRPERLLPKFQPEHLGKLVTSDDDNPSVVSIEPLGRQAIMRIDVDAKTMIVEGYAHHNCYLHTEDYLGYQGNAHWRGIVVKHQVKDGGYDLMEVSLDYLCRRYEGKPLAVWMTEQGLHEELALMGGAA